MGSTMKPVLYQVPWRGPLYKIRNSLKESIAELENRDGPAKYLTILNTPIPLGETVVKRAAANKRRRNSKLKVAPRRQVEVIEGRLGVGKNTRYSVDGSDLAIDEQTWIIGTLEIGAQVRVKHFGVKNGCPKAHSIRIISDDRH